MLIEHIRELLDGKETAYRISKETGVNVSMIQRFMNGERKIENMTLETAEKLYKYYSKTK